MSGLSGRALEQSLEEILLARLNERGGDPSDEEILRVIREILEASGSVRMLPARDRRMLETGLFRSVRRLDILQELLDDPEVTEIMVNGPDSIFIEKGGHLMRWDRTFSSAEKLYDIVVRLAGRCNRVINERSPIVDARLDDGSRMNAVIAPCAIGGPVLTIRRFPEDPITMDALIRFGSITREAASFLKMLVPAGYSILVSGGTSAGKTTFLNALSAFIPSDERIVTIEDNAELQIQGIANLVRLEAKAANMEGNAEITIRDLIKSALRMRPDRIIVGEVRGAEAIDMLQAMNTGHDGSMSTLHANSAQDSLARLATMVLMAFPLPLPAIMAQITSGVDLIIHLGRTADHKRRVLEIAEPGGAPDAPELHPLFRFDPETQTLIRCGELTRTRKLELAGHSLPGSPSRQALSPEHTRK